MNATSVPKYAVVPADFVAERALLRDVLNRNSSTALAAVSIARLDWLLDQNPAGPSVGWLLKSGPGQEVVGTGSLVPRFMAVDGASVRCARASLLAVDAGHRAFGPAAMIARRGYAAASELGFPTVLGIAPPATVPIFTRCGYVRIGDYTRYAKPLGFSAHVARVLGTARGAAWLSLVPNLLSRVFSRETWVSSGDGVIRELPGFDQRFDELWSRAGAAYGFTTARTSSFLTWRFSRCPDGHALVVHGLLSGDERELRGYAVSAMEGTHTFVFDLFADLQGDALDRMLAAVIRRARAAGAQTVSMWMGADSRFTDALARFGFRPRVDEPKPTAVLVAGYRPDVVARITDTGWYLLAADNV